MLSANSLTTRKIEKHEDPAPPQLLQLEGRIVPATITVTTTSDAVGHTGISLRDAITTANGTSANDDIVFNTGVTGTIALTAVLPNIINATTAINGGGTAGTVTITGPGASSLTISGAVGGFSIFTINSGGNLSISGVKVSGAKITGNGGAFNNAGTLTVTNSIISGNTTTFGGFGGGFNNSGTLTVTNSTISGNTATFGGGIYNFGTGILTVSNSTLSGNIATFGTGGGIHNSGTLTVSNSTLSGNTTANGGGIYNFGTLTVTNSTLSGNTATNNGGPTETMALLSGSVAIGAGAIPTITAAVTNAATVPTYVGSFIGGFTGSPSPLGGVQVGWYANGSGVTDALVTEVDSVNEKITIAPGNGMFQSGVTYSFSNYPLADQRGYTRSTTEPSIGAFEFNGIAPAPSVTSRP